MKKPIRQSFGQRVKELRLATGLSQEAFADMSGFARSYMSRLERGKANPSLDAIQTLADALGVEVLELFKIPLRIESAIMVPFAADGTCFNPTLFRPESKNFSVGSKGAVFHYKDFSVALDYLRASKKAYWQRPNANGNWGIVTAVRWAPLPDEYKEDNE